jgi:hypothetical protein
MNTAKFHLLNLLLCFGLASCWDDTPVVQHEAFGVAESSGGKLCIRDDSGGLLTPAQAITPFVDEGNRLWALFSSEHAPNGQNLDINLFDITKLYACALQTGGLDTLGNDSVELNKIWIAQGFLTLDIMVTAEDEYTLKTHTYAMYSDMNIENDTLYIDFRHNAKGDTDREKYRTGVAMKLSAFDFNSNFTVIAMTIVGNGGKTYVHYCNYAP